MNYSTIIEVLIKSAKEFVVGVAIGLLTVISLTVISQALVGNSVIFVQSTHLNYLSLVLILLIYGVVAVILSWAFGLLARFSQKQR